MTSTICRSYLVIAGFSALAAHVGGANQFHWIGWYNVAIGGALVFVLIALFRGECAWKKPEMKCTTTKCSSLKSNTTQGLIGIVVNLHMLLTSFSISIYRCSRGKLKSEQFLFL